MKMFKALIICAIIGLAVSYPSDTLTDSARDLISIFKEFKESQEESFNLKTPEGEVIIVTAIANETYFQISGSLQKDPSTVSVHKH